MRCSRIVLISIAGLAACTSDKPRNAEDSAVAARGRIDSILANSRGAVVPPGESPNAGAPGGPAATEPDAGEWEVTPAGVGAIKAGMSLDEVNIITGNGLTIPAKLEDCDYIKPRNGPKGVAIMVEKGEVARVDVMEGSVATTKGARIGDSEDRIKSLYPDQVTITPHKYTEGHYLIVTPPGGGQFRIVFETDGKRVLRYRSGREPAVQYVEGCA
jgi:hypothetical protein